MRRQMISMTKMADMGLTCLHPMDMHQCGSIQSAHCAHDVLCACRYCQGANRALKAHYNMAATEDPKTRTKPCSAEEAALRVDTGQKWLRNYGHHRTAGTTPKCYPFISKVVAAKKGVYGGGDPAAASAASSLLLVASGLTPGGASGAQSLLLPPGGIPAAAGGARSAGAAAAAAAAATRTAPRGHEARVSDGF